MALIDNLVSYYKCDEITGTNADDAHGANDGTANNARVFTSEVAGIINTGADFTAAADSIDLNAVLIPASTDFTINAWVKFTGTAKQTILSFRNVAANSGAFHAYFAAGTRFTYGTGPTLDGTDLSDNAWHMITVTRIGNDFVLYEDGSSVDTASSSAALNTDDDTVLGVLMPGFTEDLDGSLDEVGFWSAGKDSTAVGELWNSGNGLAYPFSVAAGNSQMMAANF